MVFILCDHACDSIAWNYRELATRLTSKSLSSGGLQILTTRVVGKCIASQLLSLHLVI